MNYLVSLSSGAVLHACRKDMTIRICNNNPPRQEMGLDGRWRELSGWLTLYSEEMVLRIWGFWKEGWLRFDRWSPRLDFSDLIKAVQFESRPVEMSWDLRHHKIIRCIVCVCIWGGCQYSIVSVGFHDFCLSLLVSPRTEGRKT